uniref:Uncharacterized protein n=1 Tax=Ascaris lumbricoides TaxID=6252 RepID=A0A0M3IFE5_ASCLU
MQCGSEKVQLSIDRFYSGVTKAQQPPFCTFGHAQAKQWPRRRERQQMFADKLVLYFCRFGSPPSGPSQLAQPLHFAAQPFLLLFGAACCELLSVLKV